MSSRYALLTYFIFTLLVETTLPRVSAHQLSRSSNLKARAFTFTLVVLYFLEEGRREWNALNKYVVYLQSTTKSASERTGQHNHYLHVCSFSLGTYKEN